MLKWYNRLRLVYQITGRIWEPKVRSEVERPPTCWKCPPHTFGNCQCPDNADFQLRKQGPNPWVLPAIKILQTKMKQFFLLYVFCDFLMMGQMDKEFEVWIPKKPNGSNCTGGIINYMMSGTLDSYLDWMVVRMYWLVQLVEPPMAHSATPCGSSSSIPQGSLRNTRKCYPRAEDGSTMIHSSLPVFGWKLWFKLI